MKKKSYFKACDIAVYVAKMILYSPIVASLALGLMFAFTFSLLILGADFEGFNYISCYLWMLPISFFFVLFAVVKNKINFRKKHS